jgi:hypothetical protein
VQIQVMGAAIIVHGNKENELDFPSHLRALVRISNVGFSWEPLWCRCRIRLRRLPLSP